MAPTRIYNPVKDYTLPALDLCSLIYTSPESHSDDNTILHLEAALPSNSVTKAQARVYSQRIAYALRHSYGIAADGVSGRDVVVVMSSGQVLLAPAFYGVIAAGGIYSAASSSFTVMELARQIRQGDARVVIASPDCVDVAKKAAAECGLDAGRVLVLDSMGGRRMLRSVGGGGEARNFLEGEGSVQERLHWEVVTDREVLENRVICLLYSSGTTGVPKGMSLLVFPHRRHH